MVYPEKSVWMDLVKGHKYDDPVMDMVEEKALVTGNSVHVIVDPLTSKTVRISQEWRDKLACLKPLYCTE